MASVTRSDGWHVEHYARTTSVCNSLLMLATHCPSAELLKRYSTLLRLQHCWTNNHLDVTFTCASDGVHSDDDVILENFETEPNHARSTAENDDGIDCEDGVSDTTVKFISDDVKHGSDLTESGERHISPDADEVLPSVGSVAKSRRARTRLQKGTRKNSLSKKTADSEVPEQSAPKSIPRFICSVCGRQFRLRQLLAAHAVTHTGDRPSVCRFPGCGKRFGQTSTRNYHERTHSDARPYVCAQCGRCFKQPAIFKTHLLTVHDCADQRPHRCTLCTKSFKLAGALATHVRTVHSDIRPHECAVCAKRFRYPHQLVRHDHALHSLVRPWQCTVCERTFTQPGNLRSHLRTHTKEKPFSCEFCGNNFAHSGTLKSHMQTHHCNNNNAVVAAPASAISGNCAIVPFRSQLLLAGAETKFDLSPVCLMDNSSNYAESVDPLNELNFWTA